MVARITRDGQAPPLDRVRKDDTRAIGVLVALSIRLDHGLEIMPAQIGHETAKCRVVELLAESTDLRRGSVKEAFPQFGHL